jgi:Homing endonuclease associated repeat
MNGELNINRPAGTSREQIVAAIVECAEKTGHVPSLNELTRMSTLTRRQVRKHFGSYEQALRECQFSRKGAGWKVPLETLFRDWAGVVRQMGKLPSIAEYELHSQYSQTPLVTRFGNWTQTPRALKQYAEGQGWAEEFRDVLEIIAAEDPAMTGRSGRVRRATISGPEGPRQGSRAMVGRPLYGPLMRPYPLAHGPTNEAGVIFLFGTLAERMGYVVTRMQTEFPDCEAMRLVEDDRWQRVVIEFEYESRNFLKHMHEASECDLIVCWRHNWPECPLEVVELRHEIARDRTEKTLPLMNTDHTDRKS